MEQSVLVHGRPCVLSGDAARAYLLADGRTGELLAGEATRLLAVARGAEVVRRRLDAGDIEGRAGPSEASARTGRSERGIAPVNGRPAR